jgi:hypothetical protein
MNLSLVDPFVLAQDCPEVITGRLREHPRCCLLLLAHIDTMTHSAQAAAIRRRSASAITATCLHLDGYAPFGLLLVHGD